MPTTSKNNQIELERTGGNHFAVLRFFAKKFNLVFSGFIMVNPFKPKGLKL